MRAGGSAPPAEVLARGLEAPWALAFVPGGTILVSERPGRVRVVQEAAS